MSIFQQSSIPAFHYCITSFLRIPVSQYVFIPVCQRFIFQHIMFPCIDISVFPYFTIPLSMFHRGSASIFLIPTVPLHWISLFYIECWCATNNNSDPASSSQLRPFPLPHFPYPNIPITQHPLLHFPTSQYSSFPLSRYSNVPYSNIPSSQHPDNSTLHYFNIPVSIFIMIQGNSENWKITCRNLPTSRVPRPPLL